MQCNRPGAGCLQGCLYSIHTWGNEDEHGSDKHGRGVVQHIAHGPLLPPLPHSALLLILPVAVEMTQSCLLVQAIAAHVQQRPELLPQLLTTLFELVLFEECNNQWSLSRPMLSLILVNEQIYNELRHRIIASQPVSFCMTGPGKLACFKGCVSHMLFNKLYPQYTQ